VSRRIHCLAFRPHREPFRVPRESVLPHLLPCCLLPATRYLLPVVAVLALAGCAAKPESYEQALLAARAAKDEGFRTASNSPIPPDKRAAFLPLRYFPPDPSYQAPAVLQPGEVSGGRLVMPTSAGKMRDMVRIGRLEFTLKGRPISLGAFTEADAPNLDRLFVPFTDLTTGTETYPGGRYLDLDRTPTGIYLVDFNKAYNPYCYYNPTYDCPFPPAENRLPLPIRAGERISSR
jgi:uncharacterized protein (DUF1684 family)